jgi:hypothetical protein
MGGTIESFLARTLVAPLRPFVVISVQDATRASGPYL